MDTDAAVLQTGGGSSTGRIGSHSPLLTEVEVGAYEERNGGSAALPGKVVAALVACQRDTGAPPTAKSYQLWRLSMPLNIREELPSLTAIVPIAYPTWREAREAAGVESPPSRSGSHGPSPRWTIDDCLGAVAEWSKADDSTSLVGFTQWLDTQRDSGRDLPSVSTIRLRLRRPWSDIVRAASVHGRGV